MARDRWTRWLCVRHLVRHQDSPLSRDSAGVADAAYGTGCPRQWLRCLRGYRRRHLRVVVAALCARCRLSRRRLAHYDVRRRSVADLGVRGRSGHTCATGSAAATRHRPGTREMDGRRRLWPCRPARSSADVGSRLSLAASREFVVHIRVPRRRCDRVLLDVSGCASGCHDQ